jgi:uncharacterized protein (TIGR02996 family)
VDAPDDDVPRLVYADWLEEHGSAERGQFIRLHVQWCRRPEDAPEDEDLERRLTDAWRGAGLSDLPMPKEALYVYDRGFVAAAGFGGNRPFRAQLEAAFEVAPTVRVLSLWPAWGPSLGWLAESPLLSRLTGFCCSAPFDEVGPVLASERMAGVRLLNFDFDGDGQPAAELIAKSSHLSRLTVLDLDQNHVDDEGMIALAGADHLRSLRKLDLGSFDAGHELSEAGIRALTASKSLTRLSHLAIDGSAIDGAALRRLLRWDGAARLVEVDLSFCQLTGDDVIALARCRKLRNLRRLCLSVYELNDEALGVLGSPRSLPGLRELRIEAKESYGDEPGQNAAALAWLGERLGERLNLQESWKEAFSLGPGCEEDRIWKRLCRLDRSDGDDLARIL